MYSGLAQARPELYMGQSHSEPPHLLYSRLPTNYIKNYAFALASCPVHDFMILVAIQHCYMERVISHQ